MSEFEELKKLIEQFKTTDETVAKSIAVVKMLSSDQTVEQLSNIFSPEQVVIYSLFLTIAEQADIEHFRTYIYHILQLSNSLGATRAKQLLQALKNMSTAEELSWKKRIANFISEKI